MNAHLKGALITAGYVVATLIVLRFAQSLPVVGSIAKLALGTSTTLAA